MLFPFTVNFSRAIKKSEISSQTFFQLMHENSNSEFSLSQCISSGLQSLSDYVIENWETQQDFQISQKEQIHFCQTKDALMGWTSVKEISGSSIQLCQQTNVIYHNFLQLIQELDYPFLLRIWQYFPAINEIDELERYQAFCVGRQNALEEFHINNQGYPAASALGNFSAYFNLFFIASKTPGIPIENPRQTSAYHYPKQFSPKSPAFARAIFKEWDHGYQLFISGTASIVEYLSFHHDDIYQQSLETVRNLQTLIEHTKSKTQINFFQKNANWQLKIYLRHPEHYAKVDALIKNFLPTSECLYLHADICRKELLVEIEALVSLPKT